MKGGIQNSNTEFINIMSEDLILEKSFMWIIFINAIKNNDNIDLVRYKQLSNIYISSELEFKIV